MNAVLRDESWNAMDGIVLAVADRRGVEPDELPPLFETVDTDALERLVGSSGESDLSVEFTYAGSHVQIAGDGEVTLTPTNDAPISVEGV